MQILENHKAPLCSSSSCFKWHKDKRNLVVWLLQYICTHYEQELQEKSYPLNPINTWNSSLDSYFDFSCEENISSKQWFYTDLIFSTFSYLHWASQCKEPSQSRANLKKSKVFLTNTSAASKYIKVGGPESASIEILPFRPKFT